jgi:hypothetical protein
MIELHKDGWESEQYSSAENAINFRGVSNSNPSLGPFILADVLHSS